jgi:hypothetical protein
LRSSRFGICALSLDTAKHPCSVSSVSILIIKQANHTNGLDQKN